MQYYAYAQGKGYYRPPYKGPVFVACFASSRSEACKAMIESIHEFDEIEQIITFDKMQMVGEYDDLEGMIKSIKDMWKKSKGKSGSLLDKDLLLSVVIKSLRKDYLYSDVKTMFPHDPKIKTQHYYMWRRREIVGYQYKGPYFMAGCASKEHKAYKMLLDGIKEFKEIAPYDEIRKMGKYDSLEEMIKKTEDGWSFFGYYYGCKLDKDLLLSVVTSSSRKDYPYVDGKISMT